MATSLAEIVDAVKSTLEAADLQVVGYLKDNPTVPCVQISVDEVRYHEAFALGNVAADIRISLLVCRVVDDNAYQRVYEFLDPTGDRSVRQLLETDKSLGSVVDTLAVDAGGQIQPVTIGEVVYLAAEWLVTVHVS